MTLFISVINILAIFGFSALVRRNQEPAVRPLFWPGLAFKLVAGIGLGLIYQQYYSIGDTFYLFDLARERAQLFHNDFGAYVDFLWRDVDPDWKGVARSVFFVKIISLLAIVTGNNYWVSSLWLSFLSFLASFYLVGVIVQFFSKARFASALAFLFFPSVVFWGSGVIKESVALTALLVISGIFLKVMKNRTPKPVEFVLGLFGFWIIWNLKYYWMAVLFPVVITSVVVHYGSIRFNISQRMTLVYWIGLFILLCLAVSLSHPNFYLERFLQVVVENDEAFVSASKPSDLIHYELLRASWWSVLINAPWAFFSGLFRPFLWEANTVLKVVVSLENLIILLLFAGSLGRIKDLFHGQDRLVTLSTAVYIVLLCTFLALSTPNLGSLARYKVGFLPFLVFLIVYRNPAIDFVLSLAPFKIIKKWREML